MKLFGGYPWFYREDDLQSKCISVDALSQKHVNNCWNERNGEANQLTTICTKKRYEESIQEVPHFRGRKLN